MEIKELLMKRLSYTPQEATIICNDLKNLNPSLVPLLERWIQNDEEITDTQEFNGYSINRLLNGSKMNFIAALLTLDWIIKNPEKAIPLIRCGIK